jgi:hypothetical protein
MKATNSFASITIVMGVLLLCSCNSGKEKKATEAIVDTSATKTESPGTPPVSTAGPTSIMIIKVKIANYAKWKSSYDQGDSFRLAHGLHNYVIGRGIEDSNMVIVALKMDDVNKARAMGSSKELKDRMKRSGVIGAPVIDYIEAVFNDASIIRTAMRLMISHKVKDWDQWKTVFDSHKHARGDAGLIDRVVSYTVGDNKNVSVVLAFSDTDKAKAFINSEDLKSEMTKAGVEGAANFFLFTIVEKY